MNWINTLHWIDGALLAALAAGAILGARRGVFSQTFKLAGYIIAFYAALYLHTPVQEWVRTHLTEVADKISGLHHFLGMFVLSTIAVKIGGRLARRALIAASVIPANDEVGVLEALGLKPLDCMLGAGVGILGAGLLAGSTLIFAASWQEPRINTALAESKLQPYFLQGMDKVMIAVPERTRQDFFTALTRLRDAGASVLINITAHSLDNAANRANQVANGLEFVQNAANPLPAPVPVPDTK